MKDWPTTIVLLTLLLSIVYLTFFVWEFFSLYYWEPLEDPLIELYEFYETQESPIYNFAIVSNDTDCPAGYEVNTLFAWETVEYCEYNSVYKDCSACNGNCKINDAKTHNFTTWNSKLFCI